MKVLLLGFLSLSFSILANDHLMKKDGFIEVQKVVHNYKIAPWAVLSNKNKNLFQANWPFALSSIGHTTASYQQYGWDKYFHHGLDVRGEAGESILSATDGKIVNIENYASSDLYWEVAVLDTHGFLWQYHHVDKNSIPQKIKDAYSTGASIKMGDKLGEIVYWPVVTFGERFNHIHLNVLDKNLHYVNPFLLLKKLDDRVAPTINKIGLLQKGKIFPTARIRGSYSLYVNSDDYVLHSKFKVPPYKISYFLDDKPERIVWEFKDLPGGSDNEKYVSDFFQERTCGNYDCRKFYINLNFNKDKPTRFPTAKGSHSIKVVVWDFAGNRAEKSFSWTVY